MAFLIIKDRHKFVQDRGVMLHSGLPEYGWPKCISVLLRWTMVRDGVVQS